MLFIRFEKKTKHIEEIKNNYIDDKHRVMAEGTFVFDIDPKYISEYKEPVMPVDQRKITPFVISPEFKTMRNVIGVILVGIGFVIILLSFLLK